MEKFKISLPLHSDDINLFVSVWNQGIDSHLQGFTKSTHDITDGRLNLHIDHGEMPILLRRLRETGTAGELWADDIESIFNSQCETVH